MFYCQAGQAALVALVALVAHPHQGFWLGDNISIS
jgi:hypothetical protein